MRTLRILGGIIAGGMLGLWLAPAAAGAQDEPPAPVAEQPADAEVPGEAASGAAAVEPELSEPAIEVRRAPQALPAGAEPTPGEEPGEAASAAPGEAASDAPGEAPSGEPAESEADALFSQGRDALLKGQFDEAAGLLSKAVALDGTKTGYRLHLARAHRYAGKTAEAAEQLEEILKTTPDHVEAGQELAEIHAAAEKWDEVVRILEPLLKYRHDYPTYHLLAEAEYHRGNSSKAREHYEEAIKLNPQSASDHYQLGNIYLAENLFARAAERYEAALRLGIDTPVLRYKLGSALFNLRNYFGRISVRTITSGKPDTIHEGWYLIEPAPVGKDVFRCAPEGSAIYQIARAMADGIEDRPDIHVLKATIYLNARRHARAYDMFAAIEPTVKEDRALFLYYYAQAAFGSGEYDRYLELLEEAIELDPEAYRSTRVDAYQAVADQYNQQGDLERYIEFLVKAVEESPQTASLHLKLGNAYEETRQFDKAVVRWRMVLDLEPDHPQRLRLLNLIGKYRSS
jgi:tetratricopeptide (TPR) repeat protein